MKPQLAMKWAAGPQQVAAPPCTVRTYTENDREALKTALIPLTEKRYTDQELDNIIIKRAGVRPEGIFLAETDGEVVGTTTGYFNEDGRSGTLHMVSVVEKASGKGLGKILCQHAMRYLAENGCEEVVLTTDDHRLPAIKTYLNLGFMPVITDGDIRTRWEGVYAALRLPPFV